MRHYVILVELLALAAACVVFVARYVGFHPLGRWRRMRPEGRHLLAFTSTLGALALWMLGSVYLPPFAGKKWIAPVLLAVLAALAWQRVVLLIKAQREGD